MDLRLHILEALYRFDLDELAHMRMIQEAAARHWRKRDPVVLVSGRLMGDGKFAVSPFDVTRGEDLDYDSIIRDVFTDVSCDELHKCLSASPTYGSNTEAAAKGILSAEMNMLMTRHTGIADTLGFYSGTGDGGIVGLVAILGAPSSPSQREHAHWLPLAAHLATAWRLRQRLSSGAALEDLTDAVFRPDGRAVESCVRVNGPVRERLRDFVRKRESERCGRTATRKIWSELIDGRWTLVDHFESDGRRVVIALRNMPVGESLCRLTARETDALTLARNGASNKEIGLSMKLSPSSVTRLLQMATRKLNAALADILQFSPIDTIKCRELLLGDSSLSTISADSIGEWRRALSHAENSVVSAVLRGYSNREIATMRGRSVRTVVNQLASAFEKLGVRSRREMVSRVSGLAMTTDVGEDRDRVSSARLTC